MRGRIAFRKHFRAKFIQDAEFYFAKLWSAHASSRRFVCRDRGTLFRSHQVRSAGYARFLNVTSLAIEELPAVVKTDVEAFLENSAKSRSTVAAADGNGRRYLAGLSWTEAAIRRERSGTHTL